MISNRAHCTANVKQHSLVFTALNLLTCRVGLMLFSNVTSGTPITDALLGRTPVKWLVVSAVLLLWNLRSDDIGLV